MSRGQPENNTNWFIADQGGIYTNGAVAASPTANVRGIKSFGGAVACCKVFVGCGNCGQYSLAPSGHDHWLAGLTNNNTGLYLSHRKQWCCL
jgi:hypothetical protein